MAVHLFPRRSFVKLVWVSRRYLPGRRSAAMCTLGLVYVLMILRSSQDCRDHEPWWLRYLLVHSHPVKLCSPFPEGTGNITVNRTVPTWTDLEAAHPELQPGGRWSPPDCTARHRLAIVIPYRDRETNLKLFIQHMHPFLQKQHVEYTIYVAEQLGEFKFNRGIARNVGFLEAMKLDQFECAIFNDVDLLPIDDRNLYICPDIPRHMCAGVDYQNFTLLGEMKFPFGGAVSLRNDHFVHANGYPNIYFVWGGEDDELYKRLSYLGLTPHQYPLTYGKYAGMPHSKSTDQDYTRSTTLLRRFEARLKTDGLSNLQYTMEGVQRRRLFTYLPYTFDEMPYYKEYMDRSSPKRFNLFDQPEEEDVVC